MMAARVCVAVDLGAESGRVGVVTFDGQRLTWQQVHRFANRPVRIAGNWLWNIAALWDEVLTGLTRARQVYSHLDSVGVDAWGVDYALVDGAGLPLHLPYHYRDPRTDGVPEAVWERVSRARLYRLTGIQHMPINTIYQLVAHRRSHPQLLAAADRLLLIPDLFHAWLCGERVSERTNASTTQMWSAWGEGWVDEILQALELPKAVLPPVVEAGTELAPLRAEVAERVGSTLQVVAPATHDTASAVAATPAAAGERWAFVSSGTWSLVGLERAKPLVTDASLAENFTNEGGAFGTVRLLRNVTGLWILQECQRQWAAQGRKWTYEELAAMAAAAPPDPAAVDPDDAAFLAPGHMLERVRSHLQGRGFTPPEQEGALVRAILQGLVLRYRAVLAAASRLAGLTPEVVHVVGGGAANRTLNQWLADATGWVVLAGPTEATAIGNGILQLAALGEIGSLEEARSLVRASFPLTEYRPTPGQRARWDEMFAQPRTWGTLGSP